MEKVYFLAAAINVVSELMMGARFESEELLLDFRKNLLENGYDADHILDDLSMVEALHYLCTEFAAIPLSDIKKEHDNECT